MDPSKISPEFLGIYFPEEGEALLSQEHKVRPEEVDQLSELFTKMMDEPMSPALALKMQYLTYQKALPWQITSAITKNGLSALQALMNGQV